ALPPPAPRRASELRWRQKRPCSFGKTISPGREFSASIEQDRQGEVNGGDDRERPKPPAQPATGVMPHGGGHHAGKRHRKHKFPGEIHDLIDARARERAAQPDVNKKQDRQLHEKPNVGWNEIEKVDRRLPSAEKECYAQSADREHSDV